MSNQSRARQALLGLFLSLGMCFQAIGESPQLKSHSLLIATYTQGESRGIYRSSLNEETGALSKPELAAPVDNPSWLTTNQSQTHLYAVSENGSTTKNPIGRISSYQLTNSGILRSINSQTIAGEEPTHVTVSADERFLFVSDYAVKSNPGGMLITLPLQTNGTIEPHSQVLQFAGSGVNADRQAGSHVHSAVFSPDGRYVFVCDLGGDRVYVYRYDADNKKSPLQKAATPFITFPPGSGPRHLVFSPDGKHAYVTLEMVGQVADMDYREGNLVNQQIIGLAEPGISGNQSAAAIHLSRDGRFVYATNRGSFNQIVTMSVDPNSGRLSIIQRFPVDGQEPREFSLDPEERYILVTNQKSNQIAVIRRHPTKGTLESVVSHLEISQPTQVLFVD